jgi:glycosyltransferase involved in cell wall biosynthesis
MEGSTPDIFINGRFLEQSLTGVQRYGREMLAALDRMLASEERPGERWWLLTSGDADCPPLQRVERRVIRSPLAGHPWEQVALARAARHGALISLAGSGPVLHPRHLVVMHDALVFRHPQSYSRRYALSRRTLARGLAKTSRIATVSKFSKAELAEILSIDPDAIPVFYNGCDHFAAPASVSYRTVERMGLRGQPYFVLLGSFAAHKNLALAVKALEAVPRASLVVVGGVDQRVFGQGAIGPGGDRILITGRLEDEDIRGLLTHATALVFPSLYEGFGIPPLEAMAVGCPVITSAIPAVREVCGEAAIYFDAHDPRQLASAMSAALVEPRSTRHERIRSARERARSFSWDRSAREMADFCRREIIASPFQRGR